ncbi:MAG: class I adenylate-forming enzyme family protein [Candidatus Heimdallarchaeota archaeon]
MMEDFPRIFSDLLTINGRDYADQLAVTYGRSHWTWASLDREISKVANMFLHLFPDGRGKNILIMLENRPEWLITFYGSQRAGMVPTPISTRFIHSELTHIFRKSCPQGCVTSSHFYHHIIEALTKETNPFPCVIVDERPFDKQDILIWSDLLQNASTSVPDISVSPSDLGVQLYTSGTTGQPKAVDFTHRALLDACNLIPEHGLELIIEGKIPEVAMIPTNHEPKFLVPTPLYHLSGFVPALIMTAMKRQVVFPTSLSFDPVEVARLIETERVTTVFMVPTQFRLLLDFPQLDDYDLSSVTLFSSGGAKMSASMKKEILTRFPEIVLVDGYGSTENIGAAIYSFLTNNDIPKIREGFIGKPISGVEMRIVNEKGDEIAPGEVGEAIYRSPSLMHRYHDEEKTSQAFDGSWYRTGDLFTIDEEGNYYYVDRRDELIITGGEKVYPMEVEDVLRKHPHVKNAVVIGVPHPVWGQIVKAFIEPVDYQPDIDRRKFETEIQDWCEGKIAAYKKPRIIEIRANIPMAEDGKILRALLKQKIRE